jgi:hypothetical protein
MREMTAERREETAWGSLSKAGEGGAKIWPQKAQRNGESWRNVACRRNVKIFSYGVASMKAAKVAYGVSAALMAVGNLWP